MPEAEPRGALLIVSGGNEVRAGPHRAMAMLARDLSEAGHAVLRFDRRGVGDSAGENGGFEASAPDIAVALAELRQRVPAARVVAFGICDAATALILHALPIPPDAVVLANPWAYEAEADALPSPAAVRARYLARLRDPRALLDLLRGRIAIGKLAKGIARAAKPAATTALTARVGAALAGTRLPTAILLSQRDTTAREFEAALTSVAFADARANPAVTIARRDTASHSLGAGDDALWLREALLAALAG